MPDVAVPAENSESAALGELLARAAAKDRTHIQRHLAAADAEPDASHATLWRRLAGFLHTLAPLPVQTVGHSAVMFFVPDGKYRMQMFSLEDQSDGRISLYLPDILDQAIQKKIVRKGDVPGEFSIVGSLRNSLRIDSLDSQNTPEPAAHVKNMLGWNRKALRVILPALAAEGPRVDATENLCNLAIKLRAASQAKVAVPAAAVAKPTPAVAAAPAPASKSPKRDGTKKRSA
jgi:hypothetical protein